MDCWDRVSILPLLVIALGGVVSCGGSGTDAVAGPDAPETPAVCTTGSGPFPRSLDLPNSEPNGVFDPNLARDPETGRLWMAYSGVTGPAGSGLVSIHLAYSEDDGTTWCHGGVVNQATTVPQEQQPARVAGPNGHWNHEVAALVRDPAATAESRWRLVWHRYLHVEDSDPLTDDRHFEHGWIAQRTASSPPGLLTAPETKLFAASTYYALPEIESYNDGAGGGRPLFRLDSDPDLAGCIVVTEPGVVASGGALYVTMFCFRTLQDQDIVLVRFGHGTGEWTYGGTLLTTRDAEAINPALVGFNGADIVEVGGTHRLLVSPSVGTAYLGCIEYEVDLEAGRVRDDNGDGPDPLFAVSKNEDPAVFQTGACTYEEQSPLGLIVGDTYVSGVQFRLIATGDPL
jgi:hypothetical protein